MISNWSRARALFTADVDLSVESGAAGISSTRRGTRGQNDAIVSRNIGFIGSKDSRNLEHGYKIPEVVCVETGVLG